MISEGHVMKVVDTYGFVSRIHRIGCQPEQLRANPARGLLIREKKEIEKVYQCPPPPPRCSFGGNNQKITPRIYMRLGATQVSFRLAPAQRFLRLVDWANWCRFGRFYASVCDDNFTSLSASLFFWRCLAARLSLLSFTRP